MLLGVPLIVQLILAAKVTARGGLSATNQAGHSREIVSLGSVFVPQPLLANLFHPLRTAPDSATIPDATLGGWHKKGTPPRPF